LWVKFIVGDFAMGILAEFLRAIRKGCLVLSRHFSGLGVILGRGLTKMIAVNGSQAQHQNIYLHIRAEESLTRETHLPKGQKK